MFRTSDGEEIFVVDAHIHNWDARPENQRNVHGAQFINCFHDYHKALSPEEYLWPAEKFQRYGAETLYEDLFVKGYADMAICQPTYLKEFYTEELKTPTAKKMKSLEYQKYYTGGSIVLMILVLIEIY